MTERQIWMPHLLHVVAAGLILAAFAAAGITPEVMRATGWWVPFLIINLGILAGNLFAWRLTASQDQTHAILQQGRREDLVDSHRTIVEQLRNLEAERGKLDEADYQREREALLAVGANALRELDVGPTAQAGTGEDGLRALVERLRAERDADPARFRAALDELGVVTSGGASGEWRGAAYTLGIGLLVALLFWMAGQGSRPRGANDTMTGGDGGGVAAAPMAGDEDPRFVAARQEAEAAPNDLDAQNQLTAAAIASKDMATALAANKRALEIKSDDPDARTYNAVLKAFIGRKDEALAQLKEIAAAHPTYAAAWVYQGLLLMDSAPAEALVAFEKAAAVEPSPEILRMVAVARERAAGGPPAPPAAPSAAGQPSAAGGDEVLAEGTITLADAARAEGRARLFVFLRAPTGGPPFAAVPLSPGPFPQPFRITRANIIPMMANRPLPAELVVGARLDTDGNATTKDPAEPVAEVPLGAVGASGLVLDLK